MRLLAEFRLLRILNVDWAIVLKEEANSQARIQNKGECDPLLPVHTHCHWTSLAPIVSSFRKQKFPPAKGVSKKKGVIVFSQTWDTIKVKIKLYCTIDGIHKVIEAQYSGTPHEKNTSSICVYLSLSSLSEHVLLNQA